jgi:hypothetical protein
LVASTVDRCEAVVNSDVVFVGWMMVESEERWVGRRRRGYIILCS